VENCYFKNCSIPTQVGVPGFSPAGFLVQKGCYFENCGTPQLKEKEMTGLFPYSYVLDSVMYVPCISENYVGAYKPSRTPGTYTCTPVKPSALELVGDNNSQLFFVENILNFRSNNTCPAEISILSPDGRLIDIPFRGWVEAGIDNRLELNLNHLSHGMYIVRMTTNEGKTSLKIIR
jgi:hypothetical protein